MRAGVVTAALPCGRVAVRGRLVREDKCRFCEQASAFPAFDGEVRGQRGCWRGGREGHVWVLNFGGGLGFWVEEVEGLDLIGQLG